jgi:hypothetical protein
MRKWLASIITAGVLCTILLINFNNSETEQKTDYTVNKLMSTTSHGEGS